jgi:Flagellar biosynthesis protein, FliO
MPDLNTVILAVAATLFLIALGALAVWAFRTFFGGRQSAHGFLRARDRRLGVVETASMDQRRKLVLVRRDDVEHLIIIGGAVDIVVGDRDQEPSPPGATARGRDHRQDGDAASSGFQQKLSPCEMFYG